MHLPFNLASYLGTALRQTAQGLGPAWDAFEPDVRPAAPEFGDYQANGVLTYAKSQKQNPRGLAAQLLEAFAAQQPLVQGGLLAAELSGPGFINFKASPGYLLAWLKSYAKAEALAEGACTPYKGKTIVVDYASPNIAKQMHVGHLRCIVIGEALQRLFRFAGARVIRLNHLGDWGTQFGILILAIKKEHYPLDASRPEALEELEGLYKKGVALIEANPELQEVARQELLKLQQGDAENRALWQKITAVSQQSFEAAYEAFGTQFDAVLGESFYCDKVNRVCEELLSTGIAERSQGALVVFHPEHPRFKTQPFIIRKSDEATNYATTDLASALYRLEHFQADEAVYVTDGRQQDHFEQLQLTVEKWFQRKHYRPLKIKHVWFGTVLGADGKAIKTRSGEPVKLKALIAEAINRAEALLKEKTPQLSPAERAYRARKIGLAALRYADLCQNRTSDYVFDWAKMLAFDGNTAPYLLYAVARIRSIFRKLEPIDRLPSELEAPATPFETESEMTLARKLMQFPNVVELVLQELRPHFLCNYLFELAGAFSSFYNANKVIMEVPATQARRLLLCSRTLALLEVGLDLLGIETLEQM